MNRVNIIWPSVFWLGVALQSPARGQFEVAPPPGLSPLEQATRARMIVLGKVVAIEPKPVSVERRKREAKVDHLVATIQIEDPLLGANGLTHVRVGFVPEIRVPAANPKPLFA